MLNYNPRMCDAANMTERAAKEAHMQLERLCPKKPAIGDLVSAVLADDKWDGSSEDARRRHYLAASLLVLVHDTCDQEQRVAWLPNLTRFISTTEVQLNICTRVLRVFKRHTDEHAAALTPARSSTRAVEDAEHPSPTDAA